MLQFCTDNKDIHVSQNVTSHASSTVLNNDPSWYSWPSGKSQTHPPRVEAETKVTYNMLAQNKIRGVGTTAGHTGFCGAACKKCTHTLPHQGSMFKHVNEWLPAERVVGEFLPQNPGRHISRTSKSEVVSCTFQHPTGNRSHQKLHVFERMI